MHSRIASLVTVAIIWALIWSFVPAAILTGKEISHRYGVSFSLKYARELGIDWQLAYREVLDDLGFRKLRLMSYWDEVEPIKDNYDFSKLDWQFDEANKRNAKISLVLGLRQPRWPECHQPEWARSLVREEWRTQLFDYIKTTVNRYKDHPALESWQLENEAVNRYFGECDEPDIERITHEFELIKDHDPNHPIIMSLSDQHGLPLGKPIPDIYGFSVYRIFYNWVGYKGYLVYPTPVWYHRMRAWLIRHIRHKPIIIHELQAEPWGPNATTTLSLQEQNKSMNPKQLKHNLAFAREIGIPEIDMWGAEWWYWRKVKFNDPSLWDTIKSEIKRN